MTSETCCYMEDHSKHIIISDEYACVRRLV